jgi:branched-chain amino acid transport system ATP-binding protein
MNLLQVDDLDAGYGKIDVLHAVSLSVDEGEAVTVIGSNGAGKTTLLHTISGLIPSRGGRLQLAGQELTGTSPAARVRAGVALVPEARQVFPDLSVRDNLLLGAYARRPRGDLASEVDRVIELFPSLGEKIKVDAGLLSGGQQQMLAVGRALMARPRMLLLDEPTLGLAPRIARGVAQILRQLVEEGTTLLLVEQNVTMALSVASRGYVLERGEIVLAGASSTLRADKRIIEAYLGGGTAPADSDTSSARS